MLNGQALIEHAAALLAPYTAIVVAVGGPARGSLPVVRDRPGPGLGPLGGIAGALDAASQRGFAGVLTIPCDTPALPSGLLAALLRAGPSYCAEAPVIGYWPASLCAALIEHLCAPADQEAEPRSFGLREQKDARLSIKAWARLIGAAPIAVDGPIANVNTPTDLTGLKT